jgi:hypothetical protein
MSPVKTIGTGPTKNIIDHPVFIDNIIRLNNEGFEWRQFSRRRVVSLAELFMSLEGVTRKV